MDSYMGEGAYPKMGIHTVEIDFQFGDYKGSFRTKIGGNCLGGSILQSVLSSVEDSNFTDNNGKYVGEVRLINPDGDEIELELDEELIDDVVAVRIIDWQPDKKKGVTNDYSPTT